MSNGLKVETYGTRGSIAVAGSAYLEFGGNTTCLRIHSDCIPAGEALILDMGTGFYQCSRQLVNDGIFTITILLTHGHTDHTEGIKMAPHVYIPKSLIRLYGVKEHGCGPRELLRDIMKEPHFPVHSARVQHRFEFYPIEHIGTEVFLQHPKAGRTLIPVYKLEELRAEGRQIPIGKKRVDLSECLEISMYKTRHPEYTISYRVTEHPTGKVFVFLTDHENTEGFPKDLLGHVSNADMLIADAQYSEERYLNMTSGFGHGTPQYCAELFLRAKAGKLGLTHHDPLACDADIHARLAEAQAYAVKKGVAQQEAEQRIFACRDYGVYEV